MTRDTWFSNVGPEAEANLGGFPRLKLKSIQEMSLIDVAPLKGRTVRSATLHLRSDGPPALQRVTVGSFGAEWVEGTSTTYTPQAGSSSHNHRRNPDVPWTVPGSDLCSVILGQGGDDLADGRGVAARVAGISHGFFHFDDTGTTWTRVGERFTSNHFPNRFVRSRDYNTLSTPCLMVVLDGRSESGPVRADRRLRSDSEDCIVAFLPFSPREKVPRSGG